MNHGENLEVTTLRSDIKAGDEILNYYGAMPTSEVLRRYGYVTPEYSRYDEVEVSRSAVTKALATATGLSTSELADMVSNLNDSKAIEPSLIAP